MKKIVLIVLFLCCFYVAYAATTTTSDSYDGSGTMPKNDKLSVYYTWTPADANDDFNDISVKVLSNFYGTLESIIVDANGTITNFGVSIECDPPENGETSITKLYTIKSYTIADCNDYFYPIICDSEDANNTAKPLVVGDVYITRSDLDPNINNLKVYLNCKLK